jgi:hypothetical protein
MYDWSNLKKYVEETFGVDPELVVTSFKPIKIDIPIERIKPDDKGGIIVVNEGKEYSGFVYIGDFDPHDWYNRYGHPAMPKFHHKVCRTIIEQQNKSNFDGHYIFSNKPVLLKDIDNNDKDIFVCKNCLKMEERFQSVLTTKEYCEKYLYPNFKPSDLPKVNRDIDMYGYTPFWDEMSREYRMKMKFTCESCGLKLNDIFANGFYLETHHINGNKQDNSDSNLKCLCTLCHAFQNDRHIKNYKKQITKKKLYEFIKIFEDKLKSINNPYLNRIDEILLY